MNTSMIEHNSEQQCALDQQVHHLLQMGVKVTRDGYGKKLEISARNLRSRHRLRKVDTNSKKKNNDNDTSDVKKITPINSSSSSNSLWEFHGREQPKIKKKGAGMTPSSSKRIRPKKRKRALTEDERKYLQQPQVHRKLFMEEFLETIAESIFGDHSEEVNLMKIHHELKQKFLRREYSMNNSMNLINFSVKGGVPKEMRSTNAERPAENEGKPEKQPLVWEEDESLSDIEYHEISDIITNGSVFNVNKFENKGPTKPLNFRDKYNEIQQMVK